MEASKLTKFLQWGERQSFPVQAVVVLPAAIISVAIIIPFKRSKRRILNRRLDGND